jgi:hypothetical protein
VPHTVDAMRRCRSTAGFVDTGKGFISVPHLNARFVIEKVHCSCDKKPPYCALGFVLTTRHRIVAMISFIEGTKGPTFLSGCPRP